MSNVAKLLEQTTRAFLKSYVDASQTQDMNLLNAHVTSECQRYVGPAAFLESQGAPADFSISNVEFAAEFNGMDLYRFADHIIHDLVVDAEKLKAAARTDLLVKFNDGEVLTRIFVWFLGFKEDGRKVSKVYIHNDAQEARN